MKELTYCLIGIEICIVESTLVRLGALPTITRFNKGEVEQK